VLLIDMDSQANASHGVGVRVAAGEASILEVLMGESPMGQVVRASAVPGLDVVPSSAEMAGASVLLPDLPRREYRLKDALETMRLSSDSYRYVFIDTPPSLGLLTVNSLVAADQVIVPVQAEYYALEGLAQLLSTISTIRERLNTRLRIAGLVLTMVDMRMSLARTVAEEIRTHFPDLCFKTVVPRNVRLAEAPSHGVPVSMFDPHCAGSDAYFDLALEVVKHG
jgi:chromosome partitioning protein